MRRDRNVKNIRLFLFDQKQQQVERPGKFADLDAQLIRRIGGDLGRFLMKVE